MLQILILTCLSLVAHCTPLGIGTLQPMLQEMGADVISLNNSREMVLTAEEVHDNIILNYPAELITESTQLAAFLETHPQPDQLIYLKDTQEFIEAGAITSAVSLREKRVPQDQCNPGTSHWYSHKVLAARSIWYPFQPTSDCVWTENSGGSVGKEATYTISISGNGGISLGSLTGVIGASIGFEVGVSWSDTQTVGCDIDPHSVGRVWTRKNMAWAQIRTTRHDRCGDYDPFTHWSVAPSKAKDNNNAQWRCRTGRQATACSS